ncbi:MAG: methyl-accepting chemotaxis protein [Phycisphaerales bacterium]|nr:methyl-accepting chemotaxis protein [Phycisphaerales bacterium]
MRFTIKARLWTGFGLLVAITTGVCLVARSAGEAASHATRHMTDSNAVELNAATDAQHVIAGSQAIAAEFVQKPNDSMVIKFDAAMQEGEKWLQAAGKASASDERRAMMTGLVSHVHEIQGVFKEMVDLCAARGYTEKEGAQGKLRTAAHGIEKIVTDMNLPELNVLLLNCRRHEKDYMMRGDDKYIASIAERIKEFREKMGTLELPETTFDAANKAWDDYQAGVDALVASDKALAAKHAEFDAMFERVDTDLDKVSEEAEKEFRAARDTALASLERQSTVMMIAMFVSVAVGAVIAVFSARSVTGPLARLQTQFQPIAKGDLTARVDAHDRDELGEFGQNVNNFVIAVHDGMCSVADSAREVASAATEISASSEQMARGMDQQTSQVTQISTAVEEMSSSVGDVARQSSDVSKDATESGKRAEDGGKVVELTISDMHAISESVTSSAEMVTELGKRSEQIGQIIGVINDIADQTNLLALNAAIEAARAGEHGRGFAVVADEVRKLADRTTKATDEIATSINTIRQQTTQTVSQITGGAERVSEGVRRAGEAGESLLRIIESSTQVSSKIQTIAAAAEQQGATAMEISRTLTSMTAIARESAAGAGQAATAASQLSAKSEQLNELVGRYKINHAMVAKSKSVAA